MLIAFLLNIIAILLAFLSSVKTKKQRSYGLKLAFILLGAFMAFRYGYGNDYFNYQMLYDQYNGSGVELLDFSSYAKMNPKELGWTFLCKLFKPLGYFGFLIFIAAIDNFIVYRFVKKYVNSSYYWLAVFVYTFNPYLYLIGCASMLRQWLAACIFLLAFQFLYERKWIKYFAIVFIATLFHSSAIILYPVYLLVYFAKVKFNYSTISFVVILLMAWYALAASVLGFLSPLLLSMDEWNSYEGMFMDAKGTSFGLGVLMGILLTVMCLTQIKNNEKANTLATLDYSLNMLITPIVMIVPIAARFNSYFIIMSIIVFPLAFQSFMKKNRFLGLCFLGFIMIYLLFMWFSIFTGVIWSWSFKEYHTIFEQNWQ